MVPASALGGSTEKPTGPQIRMIRFLKYECDGEQEQQLVVVVRRIQLSNALTFHARIP